jgi:hypothetical protein
MARKSIIRPWTPDDMATLEKLLREGKDNATIARKMRRSRGLIYEYTRKLRGSARRPAEGDEG